jgi:hypothetical protein
MTLEQAEILEGNILLSKYLFGETENIEFYQVGYKNSKSIYRNYHELYSDFYNNFHNDWNLLMNVVSKISKENVDDFSTEEKLIDELKNSMFQFSYDIIPSWTIVVKFIKLKLTV